MALPAAAWLRLAPRALELVQLLPVRRLRRVA
jgi:hypothetical protein